VIRRVAKIFTLFFIIIMFIFSCADLPGGNDFREIPPLDEDDITCKDFSRKITLFFRKDVDAPTGTRNFHFSVGKDYDFWVSRQGRIFIKDIDLVFDKSFAAEYLFVEDLQGDPIVSISGVGDGKVGTIEWSGKKDLAPLISRSIMNNIHEDKFYKVLKLRYRHDEKEMFRNETSLKIFLTIQACGDFTNLSPVLWDRLVMVFWN
jgi:hypothetical protein